MFFCKVPSLLVICWLITFGFHSFLLSKQTSDFLGAVSISLKGGSQEAPSHTIISPSLKGSSFRGQIETSSDNNSHSTEYLIYLTQQFLQTHSRLAFLQLLKLELLWCLMMPIKQLIELTLSIREQWYLAKPEVFIRFPAYTSGYLGDLESGVAYDSNLTGGTITSVQLSDVGSGYFYSIERNRRRCTFC